MEIHLLLVQHKDNLEVDGSLLSPGGIMEVVEVVEKMQTGSAYPTGMVKQDQVMVRSNFKLMEVQLLDCWWRRWWWNFLWSMQVQELVEEEVLVELVLVVGDQLMLLLIQVVVDGGGSGPGGTGGCRRFRYSNNKVQISIGKL